MRYVHGNILQTKIPHIIHGANAIGVMGAGVAKVLRQKYPSIFDDYVAWLEYADEINFPLLGSYATSKVENGKRFIHHIITQMTIGGIKPARYYAIQRGLLAVVRDYPRQKEFAIPKIGCGLGGCDWNIMEVHLKEIEQDCKVEFEVYSL